MKANNLKLGLSYNSLPLKNEKLDQRSIITLLNYQKGLKVKENAEKRGKGTYGSIFPYLNDTIESGGDEEQKYLSDGLLFVDLDHLKNEKADEIFSNFSEIFGKSVISCFFSASHNLHFISYSDKIFSREDYIRECKKAYASICSDLLKYYGLSYNDLLDLLWDGDKAKEDIFDFHSIKPTQRLFLFPSDYKLNTNISSVDIDESIYSDFGWIDNVQGKTKVKANTKSSGNIGEIIEKTKEKYLYKWKDKSNFPVIKRTKGTYDFLEEVYSTANDFRYSFLNTLANIEGVDFSLVQDILPDEHNEVELFAQWNYGVEHGLSLGKFIRYLYISNYIEPTEESEAVELYNYKEELEEKDGNWEIIDDGKYIGDSKDSILKVLEQNQTLFIESGCGTGKTTLITKILSEGKALGKNILGFCPLNSILSQSYNVFELKDKTTYNGVGCYFTNFDFIKNPNFVISETKVLETLKKSGGYIIVDEIHELFEASEYREIMEKFLAFLDRVKHTGVKILAFTGTPFTYHPNLFNKTLKFCRKNVEEKDEYEINIYEGGKGNWSDSVEYILKHQEENTKYIIFNDKDRKDIGREFKNNVFFDFDDICRADRNYEDLTLQDNSTNILLNTHGFLPQDIDVFVATSYIKEGVNIEDVDSKVIFLSDIENLGDVVSLVQLGGRTRKQKHIIKLFVKSLEDFNTSKKSTYIASDRFSKCEKGDLYKDYLAFVDSFKSLDDWIKYIKDHRLPVVINKINNIGLGKRQKESKYLKLKDMDKILNTKLNDSSKKLFQVCSVGAKESTNPDFEENGFLIVPSVSKYYENKIYFGTKNIGRQILKLLNLCEASKLIAENEKEGIDLNKLDLLYDLYNLAEDIYNWTKDLDGVKELKKDEVSIFRENFIYSLMIPYDKKYEIILSHYSNTDPLRLYNSGLLQYTEVEIYDVTKKALLNDPTLIDKVIKKHKIFRLFQKYPRTLAVLLNYFWETGGNIYSTKVQDNWPEIEDIFLDEHSNNIQALAEIKSGNAKKQVIFVIGGKEKIYNSKAEVDKDYKLFGLNYRDWKNNKKALYNLNDGEVLGNIKKVGDKYVIL